MSEISKVRCKFTCTRNEPTGTVDVQHDLAFEPVYCGSAENEQFFKYTPGGFVSLSVVSPETAGFFEVGKEYYVDLIPAIPADES